MNKTTKNSICHVSKKIENKLYLKFKNITNDTFKNIKNQYFNIRPPKIQKVKTNNKVISRSLKKFRIHKLVRIEIINNDILKPES